MPSAKDTYKVRQKEIATHIKLLQAKLKKHEQAFKKNTTNWGYAGDLGWVKEKLAEVNGFIK